MKQTITRAEYERIANAVLMADSIDTPRRSPAAKKLHDSRAHWSDKQHDAFFRKHSKEFRSVLKIAFPFSWQLIDWCETETTDALRKFLRRVEVVPE